MAFLGADGATALGYAALFLYVQDVFDMWGSLGVHGGANLSRAVEDGRYYLAEMEQNCG
jgi:hypothetical protein